MADITADLEAALNAHNAHISRHRRFQSDVVDEFLKEAYRIQSHLYSLHAYLRSIRQSYLSTSLPPHRLRNASARSATAGPQQDRKYLTDVQRDQIDNESKATLRELNAGIRQLEDVEQLRKDTDAQLAARKRGRDIFRGLGQWAAGGAGVPTRSPEEEIEDARRETVNVHRESVIWYLRRKLEEAAELQRGMMEMRIEREVEKSKSVLYKTRGVKGMMDDSSDFQHANGAVGKGASSGGGYRGKAAMMDESDRKQIEQGLSPEQLQLFAEENNEMLKHYEDTLDQVRTAERSMLEISELQTTLAQNLEIQSMRIDQLVEDSANTEQNVAGGNKQLKQASEKWRPAKFCFYASCGLSAFLIAWDLIF